MVFVITEKSNNAPQRLVLRHLLRKRAFRWMWAGQLISGIGNEIFPIAMISMLLSHGRGVGTLGYVLAARALAMAIVIILGGVIADRLPRVAVLFGTDILRAAGVAVLLFVPISSPTWAFAAITFVLGAAEACFYPAYASLVPDVVDKSDLQAANALSSGSMRAIKIAGPLIGGIVVAALGTTVAIAFDVVTFIASAATLWMIRNVASSPRCTGKRTSILKDVGGGIRAVRERPWLATLCILAAIQVMLAVAPWFVILPTVAMQRLGGEVALGVLSASFGVGGVIAAAVAIKWRPARVGLVALGGVSLFAIAELAAAHSSSLLIVAGAVAIAAFGIELFDILKTTAVQKDVPRELLGRVMSLDMLGTLALLPLGQAMTGFAIGLFGISSLLTFGAVVVFLTAFLALLVPGVSTFSTPKRRAESETPTPVDLAA